MHAEGRPSSRHSKVAGSSAEKVNVALVAEVGSAGPEWIVVFGGVRSATSHSNWAGIRLAWPAALIACTSNVYSSSPRFSYVFGDVQVSQAVPVVSPVRRHSNVLGAWSELKVKVAVRLSFWMSGSSGA